MRRLIHYSNWCILVTLPQLHKVTLYKHKNIEQVGRNLRCGVQKVQDKMLAEVQMWCRGCRGGACGAGRVQGRCRWCRGGAGYLHRLHLSKHNIRCREVQGVQAHLRAKLLAFV